MSDINTGLDDNSRTAVAAGLKALLADTYALYIKTHSYHWNVMGMNFQSLHTLFEAQYNESWKALDDIAERLRALGEFAPTNGKAFAELTVIAPASDTPPDDITMVKDLIADTETLIRRARENLAIAEEVGDAASADLITVRIQEHEKSAWMLRATAS